ncbi:hypothetical protein HispidOSU_018697, partial [Sigmodon hispidus]
SHSHSLQDANVGSYGGCPNILESFSWQILGNFKLRYTSTAENVQLKGKLRIHSKSPRKHKESSRIKHFTELSESRSANKNGLVHWVYVQKEKGVNLVLAADSVILPSCKRS